MNQPNTVSKVRARKTRSREKQAGKEKTVRTPLPEQPVIGLLIALLLVAASVGVIGAEDIVRGHLDSAALLRLIGDGGLLLISLLATGMLVKTVQPDLLKRNMCILMLALVAFLSIVAGKATFVIMVSGGFMDAASAPYFLPVEMAPLFAAILVNGPIAIAVGLWTSLAMGIIAGHNFTVIVVGAVATMVTARVAYRVRTRSRVARAGLLIGLCKVACVIAFVTVDAQAAPNVMPVLNRAGACIISGFASAIIVLLILPLFEQLFRVTTDITLLELSDLGHPLLQRLALEAPGTYHHSLVVANLAQAAADRIGANSLLARVACYFHDVGKLTKPSFFTENMHVERNPHDDLPPSMSTLVITSHVKEGLSLAVLYKLPQPIVDVIVEHHGTSLISYFHRKAKDQLKAAPEGEGARPPNGAGKRLDDSAFRYAGPKPSTRESAIVCLADAAEAASRSLEKTTPNHIEGVIDGIVRARIEDGQLDNSGLTLNELATIKRSFLFTLTNMLHGRIPYPKDEDNDQQPPKDSKDQSAGSAEARARPDVSGEAA